MAFNNKEIEIQAKVEHVASLLDFLQANAVHMGETYQRDEYYTPKHKNYLDIRPVAEWLRLREENGDASICYKNWHSDENGKGVYCDEYETNMGSMEKARLILEALDCQLLTIVDKKRTVWKWLDWHISIDNVQNLGEFVEVEYSGGTEVEPSEETIKMIAFLKSHGCGKVELNYTGYPFLFLFPEEARFEEV